MLSKIYDENISILGCGLYVDDNVPMPFLHPIDNDWNGFVIRVDRNDNIAFDFKMVVDAPLEEDQDFDDTISHEKELTFPLDLGEINVEMTNELISQMANLRKGIKQVITVPLSKNAIAIAEGVDLEEKYKNLHYESDTLTKREKDNFNKIKNILEENLEECDE